VGADPRGRVHAEPRPVSRTQAAGRTPSLLPLIVAGGLVECGLDHVAKAEEVDLEEGDGRHGGQVELLNRRFNVVQRREGFRAGKIRKRLLAKVGPLVVLHVGKAEVDGIPMDAMGHGRPGELRREPGADLASDLRPFCCAGARGQWPAFADEALVMVEGGRDRGEDAAPGAPPF
jgi:hypothetical protein